MNHSQPQRVVIVGGVAAGPKVAARIMRVNPQAEVTIVERGRLLSYAGCGLPYFIADTVKEETELRSTPVGVVRDPTFFEKVKDFEVLCRTEATAIDRKNKQLKVRSLDEERDYLLDYDQLVLCTGAYPITPQLPGIDLEGVHQLQKIEDAESIRKQIDTRDLQTTTDSTRSGPMRVVLIGGGLIGVEMAESLIQRGCEVTMIEMLDHILPMLDHDMAAIVEKHMRQKGVRLMTGASVRSITGDENGCVTQVVTERDSIEADMVIVSVGVRPNVQLAQEAGIEIGFTGAIRVNTRMQTSDPDIFAAGDCCESTNLVSGQACHIPLGSTANKQGRVVANNICGINDEFPGVLASGVCRVFDFSVARTGLTESQAAGLDIDAEWTIVPGPDKPHFMPEAKPIMVKLVADRKTRKLLGAQAIGLGDCVKRVDAAAVALTCGMTVDQLAEVDLCYAPPFAPAMDNLITTANVLRNKLDGLYQGIKASLVKQWQDEEKAFILLDVRTPGEYEQMHIPGSTLIPLGKVRPSIDQLPKDQPIVVFCKISLRGFEAARMLMAAGIQGVHVMEGGVLMWPYRLEIGE